MATIHALPSPLPLLAKRFAARPAPRLLAVLALVGANVLWGGSAAASTVALVHIPPLTLACLRVALAYLVLLALVHHRGERPATGRVVARWGLIGVAIFCTVQNLGLRAADPSTASLLNGAIPVLTALLAVPVLGERLGGRRLAGLLVSLTGVATVVLLGSGAAPGTAALGNLLPLIGAACVATYVVLGRRAFGGGSALAVVAGSTRYGLLFLLPGALIELATVEVGPLALRDGLLLLYLGAGCSALAFVLCGYGLAHFQAGHAAAFGNLNPLVGVALAVVLLGEPLTAGQLGGGALVLLGVGVASHGRTAAETALVAAAPARSRFRPRRRLRPWAFLLRTVVP
ncbi:MAG: DMT family transporter [Chloroflexota bacterium]|nr:DMT family transporter [Chloroflexota bacterium]